MIRKIACVSVMATAVLAAPAVSAAQAAPLPRPSAGAPGAALLNNLLGSLEIGHPATSPQPLLPSGLLGK
ncbi:hypothetical protein HF200_16245 [Streptomyces galbus]|uniref:ATP-binding protein n=1 Tax=Streptomyces galbus TaxID=33898 RepID=A0ABX1IJY6_STRGB|nr:hypothetical protein [Streptomyces galbus]